MLRAEARQSSCGDCVMPGWCSGWCPRRTAVHGFVHTVGSSQPVNVFQLSAGTLVSVPLGSVQGIQEYFEKHAPGLIVVELADPACMSWGNLMSPAFCLSVNVSYSSCLWCV